MDRVTAARADSPVLTTSSLVQAPNVTKKQFEGGHRGNPPVALDEAFLQVAAARNVTFDFSVAAQDRKRSKEKE